MTQTSAPPERAPDRTRMLDLNGTSLRIWEWGDDDPRAPLILLGHGAFDHGRMMDGMGAALSDAGFACWAPDLRGHGDSGRVAHGSTFVPTVSDIGSLVADTDRRVGLLGHSMSGGLFMQSAAVWPSRFDWVVSLDSVGPPAESFERPDLVEACTFAFDRLVKSVTRSARVFPDLQVMFEQRSGLNTRVPELWMRHLVEHGTSLVDGGFRWKYDSLFNAWIPGAFRKEWLLEDFAAIESPVLLLTGGVDELWSDLPIEEIEARLAHLRNARHVVVPGAGHYVHLENEAFVLDAVRSFLAEVGW